MTRKFTYGKEFSINEAKNFIKLIDKLNDWNKIELIFSDLLSPQEAEEINRRLEASFLLLKGKTFKEISERLGMSEPTIQKIHSKLKYGRGGYILAAETIGIIKIKDKKTSDNYLHPMDHYLKVRLAKGK
ncbi:MAG: Trp family transcriptional regulator [Candidatus Berkelbacteria bacterium]|nr:Trp family transcriptional regulator [Candidatus Berkelbacteria bacterium]